MYQAFSSHIDVCMCIHTCTSTYMTDTPVDYSTRTVDCWHTRMHAYIHTYMHTYIYTYMPVKHACRHTYTYMQQAEWTAGAQHYKKLEKAMNAILKQRAAEAKK